MAVERKDTQLYSRVSKAFKEKVLKYLFTAKISEGELVRRAVEEYLHNNPLQG